MTTKEKLLALFEEHKGIYFSGEELADKLDLSRTAIWKGVNALRSEGYVIDAVPNRGYRLSEDTDILSAQGIQKYLNEACSSIQLNVLPEVTSTNSWLREKANGGAREGCTVISGRQTAGRGRLGRSFYSPENTGIYMSILLRPEGITPDRAVKITTMAAAAACEAVREVSGRPAGIKWVNDIFIDGKKVCGILTEASLGMENNSLEYAVLGIGINAYAPQGGFPDEISRIAGSVFTERQKDGKNALAAAFLNHFMNYYISKDHSVYVNKYRDMSLAIGKEINVISPEGQKKARALDVDDECRLVVEYADGQKDCLSSGEISIRLI